MTELMRKHGERLTSRKFIAVLIIELVLSAALFYSISVQMEALAMGIVTALTVLIERFFAHNTKQKELSNGSISK